MCAIDMVRLVSMTATTALQALQLTHTEQGD